jgi:hypothetical protein
MQRKQACPPYPQKQTPLGIFAFGDEERSVVHSKHLAV